MFAAGPPPAPPKASPWRTPALYSKALKPAWQRSQNTAVTLPLPWILAGLLLDLDARTYWSPHSCWRDRVVSADSDSHGSRYCQIT